MKPKEAKSQEGMNCVQARNMHAPLACRSSLRRKLPVFWLFRRVVAVVAAGLAQISAKFGPKIYLRRQRAHSRCACAGSFESPV
jgi:hypothetical protein